MTPLDRFCSAYADEFRNGFLRVGGREYPMWKEYPAAVRTETMRCMRHALETLRGQGIDADAFDAMFPEPCVKRALPLSAQDELMAEKMRTERYE